MTRNLLRMGCSRHGINLFPYLIIPLLLLTATCVKKEKKYPPSGTSAKNNVEMVTGPLDRCVALRGNGTHMIAHLSALAKITSRWGEIQGLAGGSSSTISSFFYESILLNPAIKSLSAEAKPKAISLLLKSLTGYALDTLAEPEWKALTTLGNLATIAMSSGAMSLPASQYASASSALLTVLNNADTRDLVNPEIISMLENRDSPAFKDFQTKVEEVKKSVASLTNLDASDPDVFFRPGLINFPHFIKLMGYVADFYASYGSTQPAMAEFLRVCAAETDLSLWTEISQKPVTGGTCGQQFATMVHTWRSTRTSDGPSRLTDAPGLALRTIMITSEVSSPTALKKLHDFEAAYHKGVDRTLGINFDEVNFGYWISPTIDQGVLDKWSKENSDGKSKKAVNLGSAKTWREILEKSPQEPSLGRYVEFASEEAHASTNPGAVSLGGWADLHPVQVLKAAGCAKVIYVTRRTEETSFITAGSPTPERKPSGLAELLGMKKSDYDEIYSLSSTTSAFSKALAQADGIWCSHWNDFSATQQYEIGGDSWVGPLISKDPELLKWPEASSDRTPIVGCL